MFLQTPLGSMPHLLHFSVKANVCSCLVIKKDKVGSWNIVEMDRLKRVLGIAKYSSEKKRLY